MEPIQLLYARNIISRYQDCKQDLDFGVLVEDLAYDKQVDVLWAGEDGIWHVLPAAYRGAKGQNHELWHAQAAFYLSDEISLPGDIQFALRYRVLGAEYWDNNHHRNYLINADSGVQLARQIPLLDIDFNPALQPNQQVYPITIAVRQSLRPKQVYVVWTTDRWHTVHTTPCFFRRKHWDRTWGSYARNPNRYDCGIWISQINVGDAYRVEYAIACQTEKEIFWDNNLGENYQARRERIKVMTLNLHCYQEDNQDAKLTRIAEVISDLDIDIVCLQEVAENWNGGHGHWNSNAAKIIRDRLRRPYHVYTDWSHLGFRDYREGIAILSKHEILGRDAGYVSSSQDVYNIHARKVVMAQVSVPYVGIVNVFSAHLSWWSDGFLEQFGRVRNWANGRHANEVAATLLCGDFNVKAGSQGYMAIVDTQEYEDQFLRATAPEVFEKVFERWDLQPHVHLNDDHRIDYIFMRKGGRLEALSARTLFTEQDYGTVSDHCGYYVEFEPA